MEYAYAIDSLYYVLSLLLIAAGALRVTSWLSKVAIAIGAALLAMTLYYSVTNVELTVLRSRLRGIKATTCPYC